MPKKTSRPARALQAQRSATVGGVRKSTARPLVDLDTSRLAASDVSDEEIDNSELGSLLPSKAIYETPSPVINDTVSREDTTAMMRDTNTTTTTTTTIRPATSSRRPIGRRTTSPVQKQPVLTREEEYAFIRSDLVTVFVLTVLMIVALVVLTVVLN